jgi:hypothetical protein
MIGDMATADPVGGVHSGFSVARSVNLPAGPSH